MTIREIIADILLQRENFYYKYRVAGNALFEKMTEQEKKKWVELEKDLNNLLPKLPLHY